MRNALSVEHSLRDRLLRDLAGWGPTRDIEWVDDTPADGGDARLVWRLRTGLVILDVELKRGSITSRADVARLLARKGAGDRILLATFLSPPVRDELEHAGWSYWDELGNALIQHSDPLVWIQREGARRDPSPDTVKDTRKLHSLKGRSTSEVIVYLLANAFGAGVRTISRDTGVALGTVSRVVERLRADDLLAETSGKVMLENRMATAERWAEDYSFAGTFKAQRYFSMLGRDLAMSALEASGTDFAYTGILAAADYLRRRDQVVLPADEVWAYVADRDKLERDLRLTPDPRGDIVLSEWNPTVALEGVRREGSLLFARPWRNVGDLLSTRGRTASVGHLLATTLIDKGLTP